MDQADQAAARGSRSPYLGLLAAGALAGLGLAAVNSWLARRSEQRHPPRGRFVNVDGVRLHYREWGQGAPIALIHGNGVTSEDFLISGLFARLARRGRVIAFDRPGFGYSERPRGRAWGADDQARLLLSALDQLGASRPVVVGHSWGAMIAANIGLQAPAELAGLALLSGYYRPTPRPDTWLFGAPAIPILGDVMRFTVSPLAGRLLTPMILRQVFAPAPVAPRFRREMPLALSLRPWQLRAEAAESLRLRPAAAALAADATSLSDLPVLILGGRDDEFIDFDHQSRWLAARLPNAKLVAVPHAGHMVHHTAPDEVARAIEELLDFTAAEPRVDAAAAQSGLESAPAV